MIPAVINEENCGTNPLITPTLHPKFSKIKTLESYIPGFKLVKQN